MGAQGGGTGHPAVAPGTLPWHPAGRGTVGTHLTSTSPPSCMRKEPSGCFRECRYASSFFLREPAGLLRGGGDDTGILPLPAPFHLAGPPPQSPPAVPVDDAERLLGADDAERVDGGVGGGEVGVLLGTPPKTPLGALAEAQELADAGGRGGRHREEVWGDSGRVEKGLPDTWGG